MKLPTKPRIAVVGSGALGGYVGGRLAHYGLDIHFLVRSDFETLRKQGWLIDSIGESRFSVHPAHVYRQAEEIGPVDVVFIALKTTQNDVLGKLVRPLVRNKKTLLVSLQNGMGVTDRLAAEFPNQLIAAGLCYIAVNRAGPGHVVNQAPRGGRMRLAGKCSEAGEAVAELSELISASGIHCETLPDLEEAVWRKLMWNVPFNGLPVAMGGCGSDTIMNDEALLGVTRSLMEELRAAAKARGFPIEPEFTEQLIEYTRHLGAYQASTVVDYLAGRSLEVEAIWGETLRRGRNVGVPMPHLATLYAILKGIDTLRGKE